MPVLGLGGVGREDGTQELSYFRSYHTSRRPTLSLSKPNHSRGAACGERCELATACHAAGAVAGVDAVEHVLKGPPPRRWRIMRSSIVTLSEAKGAIPDHAPFALLR